MTKVFIAGSRRLSRLTADVKHRIDNMIDQGFTILVGDANGADKAVQRYLANRQYSHVVVYCMDKHCRNNVANWPTREVAAPPGARGFAYYATKDQVMVDDAAYGLMLWDGESKGTFNSVINMLRQDKPVAVYLSPQKAFRNVKSAEDAIELLSQCTRETVDRFERDLRLDHVLGRQSAT